MHTATTEIEINNEPFEVTIDFAFYPGDPGVHTYSNGDPGYPPSGDEVDVLSVQDKNGNTVPDSLISQKWVDHIIEVCHKHIEELGNNN